MWRSCGAGVDEENTCWQFWLLTVGQAAWKSTMATTNTAPFPHTGGDGMRDGCEGAILLLVALVTSRVGRFTLNAKLAYQWVARHVPSQLMRYCCCLWAVPVGYCVRWQGMAVPQARWQDPELGSHSMTAGITTSSSPFGDGQACSVSWGRLIVVWAARCEMAHHWVPNAASGGDPSSYFTDNLHAPKWLILTTSKTLS